MVKMLTCLDVFISISDTDFIESFTSLCKIFSQRLILNKLNLHLFYISIMPFSSSATDASDNSSFEAEYNSSHSYKCSFQLQLVE